MKWYNVLWALLILAATTAWAAPLREGKGNNEGWGEFVDPDKDCRVEIAKGKAILLVPGTDHDLGIERGKMNAPRLMQDVEGDFIIQVQVSGKFEPRDPNNNDRRAYHGAGFFVQKDDRTYVRLDRATYWDGIQERIYANFELRLDGNIERFGTPDDLTLVADKATFLKIERRGNQLYGYASQEPGKWHALGDKVVDLPKRLRVGVAAINTSLQPFAPVFADLKLEVAKAPAKD